MTGGDDCCCCFAFVVVDSLKNRTKTEIETQTQNTKTEVSKNRNTTSHAQHCEQRAKATSFCLFFDFLKERIEILTNKKNGISSKKTYHQHQYYYTTKTNEIVTINRYFCYKIYIYLFNPAFELTLERNIGFSSSIILIFDQKKNQSQQNDNTFTKAKV